MYIKRWITHLVNGKKIGPESFNPPKILIHLPSYRVAVLVSISKYLIFQTFPVLRICRTLLAVNRTIRQQVRISRALSSFVPVGINSVFRREPEVTKYCYPQSDEPPSRHLLPSDAAPHTVGYQR